LQCAKNSFSEEFERKSLSPSKRYNVWMCGERRVKAPCYVRNVFSLSCAREGDVRALGPDGRRVRSALAAQAVYLPQSRHFETGGKGDGQGTMLCAERFQSLWAGRRRDPS